MFLFLKVIFKIFSVVYMTKYPSDFWYAAINPNLISVEKESKRKPH